MYKDSYSNDIDNTEDGMSFQPSEISLLAKFQRRITKSLVLVKSLTANLQIKIIWYAETTRIVFAMLYLAWFILMRLVLSYRGLAQRLVRWPLKPVTLVRLQYPLI